MIDATGKKNSYVISSQTLAIFTILDIKAIMPKRREMELDYC